MKRTTTRRRREIRRFVTDNRRLFPFVGLFALGVALGVAVYAAAPQNIPAALLTLPTVGEGAAGWWQTLGSCCFATLWLLAALYLLGLWGCGAPFILAIPAFYGLGVGMTEAYYYTHGLQGFVTVAVAVMPVALLTAVVLTMAGAESLRLSLILSRRLLGQTDADLSENFRLYCLRFLLFLLAALVVSLVDVLLRGLLPHLVPT